MKISDIIKIFVIIMIGCFLFLGCGGGGDAGSDETCEGADCSGTGGGDDSGGGDTGGITAVLNYYWMERSIMDAAAGLLNLRNHPIATDSIVHHPLEDTYLKVVTYHNVPSPIARALYPYLTEASYLYEDRDCADMWAEPQTTNGLCGTFAIDGSDIGIPGINTGFVAFEQADSVNCGGETCSVSLGMRTDSSAYKMTETETIPQNIFRDVFITGVDGAERNNAIKNIENSAQGVTVQIEKYFINLDAAGLFNVNATIVQYVDQLKVNSPVAFEQNDKDLTLTYQGAKYEIKSELEDDDIALRFFVTGAKINLGW